MKQLYFVVHYPESFWGDDLVAFTVPCEVEEEEMRLEIMEAMNDIPQDSLLESLQDWADKVFNHAVWNVGGEGWSFVEPVSEVSVMWKE